MIFADTTPSWSSTVAVLSMCGTAVGIFLSGLVVYYMKIQSDSFREQTGMMRQQLSNPPEQKITPQPLKVQAADDYAHRHELERVAQEVKNLEAVRKDDVGKLHEKINGVDRKVAGLETSTQMQNQKLSSMDSKLDRLIERK